MYLTERERRAKKLERLADKLLRTSTKSARATKVTPLMRARAKHLTKKAFKSEEWFDQLLKAGSVGGYYRNYVHHPFIIDFAFPSLGIGIEIDGSSHDRVEAKERDQIRDFRLRMANWLMVRIPYPDQGGIADSVVACLAKIREDGVRKPKAAKKRMVAALKEHKNKPAVELERTLEELVEINLYGYSRSR